MGLDKSKKCGIISMNNPVKLKQSEIRAIEKTLSNGDRVEIVPVKDGVRVVRVKREEIK